MRALWKTLKSVQVIKPTKATKACKVALESGFVENIINNTSNELLLQFVIYISRDVLKAF